MYRKLVRVIKSVERENSSKMSKRLGVFDFDHTIVDDNTDIVARKLLKNDQIPDSTKILYRSSGWTAYMQEIFKLLHKYHIKESTIKNAITKIPPVQSISDLIVKMVEKLNFEVIIISDSNSVFINDWLIAKKLDKYVHTVFTNPAKYNHKGLLQVEMYHVQKECTLSTVNLCKGMIMEDFIQSQAEDGINYSQIVYVGDGKNDFCPILRLKKNDVACVRAGYACVELVTKSFESQSEDRVKSNVCIWNNGLDILKSLQQNLIED